jgi:hypothetical protein
MEGRLSSGHQSAGQATLGIGPPENGDQAEVSERLPRAAAEGTQCCGAEHEPLSLPKRSYACEWHSVLGAVVGHITDLEAIAGRRSIGRRARRSNAVIDQQSRPQTEPIPAATRNLHLNNATSAATFARTAQPSREQDNHYQPPALLLLSNRPFQLKVARDCPACLGFAK